MVVRDREGDARVHLAGSALELDRRGRLRVRGASGILYVTGSKVTVQVTGQGLAFSVAGNGTAGFLDFVLALGVAGGARPSYVDLNATRITAASFFMTWDAPDGGAL